MDCTEARDLVGAMIDRELDLRSEAEVREHVSSCPACGAEYARQQAVRAALQGIPAYEPPDRLVAAIRRRTVGQASLPASVGGTERDFPTPKADRPGHINRARPEGSPVMRPLGGPRLAAIGLLFACVALAGFFLGRNTRAPSSAAVSISQEVVACHVRSLMAGHLLDVVSTDKHTVKPWYAGRLSFSPPVIDLSDSGYTLAGGRLDYVDGHPAAALVYRVRKHIVNVFVWPEGAANTSPSRLVSNPDLGYNIEQWQSAGMSWWAVSDMSSGDLARFAVDLDQATQTTGAQRPAAVP